MKGHQNLKVEQELKNAGFFFLSGEGGFFFHTKLIIKNKIPECRLLQHQL